MYITTNRDILISFAKMAHRTAPLKLWGDFGTSSITRVLCWPFSKAVVESNWIVDLCVLSGSSARSIYPKVTKWESAIAFGRAFCTITSGTNYPRVSTWSTRGRSELPVSFDTHTKSDNYL